MTHKLTTSCWLLVQGKKSHYGWQIGKTEVRANKPATAKDQVAIKLEISLPAALFERPQLEARIEVADQDVPGPIVNADVVDNVASILSAQLGMTVRVTSEAASE